jgi:hypothetical protein
MLVSPEQIQAAFDYFEGEADSAAQARADLTLADYRVKSTRARLVLSAPKELRSVDLRKAWAESHEDYIHAYEDEARATKQWELHVRMKAWADAIYNAWRTINANERSLGKF